jgi:hypothetical protein
MLTPKRYTSPRIKAARIFAGVLSGVLAAALAVSCIGAWATTGNVGVLVLGLVLAVPIGIYSFLVWTWRIHFYAILNGAVWVSKSGGHHHRRLGGRRPEQ